MQISKPTNQMWAFLIAQINSWLVDSGFQTVGPDGNYVSGWQVCRNYQPTIQPLQSQMIYLHQISVRRYGIQGTKSVKNSDGTWDEVDCWYEEHMIQVSAFMPRNPATENADTPTSEDIITALMGFINSGQKNQEWNAAGYQVIKTDGMRDIDYETDSGLNEKLPQFDFYLVVEQLSLKKIPEVDKIDITTKRI